MALAKGQSLASGPLPRDDSAGSSAPGLEGTESSAPAVNFAGDSGAVQDGGESVLPHGHPDMLVAGERGAGLSSIRAGVPPGVPGLPPGAREIFPRRSTFDGIPFRPVNPRGKGAIISERAEQARQSQVTIPHQPSAVQPRTPGDQQQKPQNASESTVEPQQQQMPIQRQNQIQHVQLQKKQQLQAAKQATQLQQRQKQTLQQQQQAQQQQAQQKQAQLQQQHKQQQQALHDRDKIQQEAMARQAHLRQQAQQKLLSTGQTLQHQPRNQQLLQQQQDQQQPQQQGKPSTSAAVVATTADARLTDATKIAPAGTGASTGPHLTAGGYVRPSEDGAASAWQAQIKASHHAQTQAQVQALAKKLSEQAAAQAQALAPAKGQAPAPAQTHAPAQTQTALAQPQAPTQIQAHAQQLPVAQKQTPRAQHAIAAAAASPQGSSTMPPPRSAVQPPPASANVQQQQHRQQQHRQEQQISFGGGAAAKAMPQMRPLHPVMVPPVEPEPKDAKLTGPMNGIRMAALMDEVDPEFTLHSDTEELLLALAQNHIEGVATAAVELARHRRSDIVEVQDLQLCLDKDWDMPWLGVGNPARSGSRNEVKSNRTKLNAAVAADRAKVASTANASARKRAQKRGRDASGGGGGGGVDVKRARPQAAEGIGATGGAAVGGGAATTTSF